jgi:L-asparaginase
VFVVSTTRTGSGRIAPPRTTGTPPNPKFSDDQRRRLSFSVAGEDHLPVKARILLMLALTQTTDRAEIQRMFSEY